jgi:hypothetical protein
MNRRAKSYCSGGLWSLSDLGIFGPKTGIFDHQNSLAKNQNRLYAILERRPFQSPTDSSGRCRKKVRRSESAATKLSRVAMYDVRRHNGRDVHVSEGR